MRENKFSESFFINLQFSSTNTYTLKQKCNQETSILTVKQLIGNEKNRNYNDIQLKYNNTILKDDKTLQYYGICDSRHLIQVLFMVQSSSKSSLMNKSYNNMPHYGSFLPNDKIVQPNHFHTPSFTPIHSPINTTSYSPIFNYNYYDDRYSIDDRETDLSCSCIRQWILTHKIIIIFGSVLLLDIIAIMMSLIYTNTDKICFQINDTITIQVGAKYLLVLLSWFIDLACTDDDCNIMIPLISLFTIGISVYGISQYFMDIDICQESPQGIMCITWSIINIIAPCVLCFYRRLWVFDIS